MLIDYGLEPSAMDGAHHTAIEKAAMFGAAAVVAALVPHSSAETIASAYSTAMQHGQVECAQLTGSTASRQSLETYRDVVDFATSQPAGWQFTDKDFMPCCRSLSKDGVCAQSADISWARPAALWPECSDAAHELRKSTQPPVGATWFWASCVNDDDSVHIEQPAVNCGVYEVTLRGKKVLVDDNIPCIDGVAAYDQSNLWGALVLKAHAKLQGSYQEALHPDYNCSTLNAVLPEGKDRFVEMMQDGVRTVMSIAATIDEQLVTSKGLVAVSQALQSGCLQRSKLQLKLPLYEIKACCVSEPTAVTLSITGSVPLGLTVSHFVGSLRVGQQKLSSVSANEFVLNDAQHTEAHRLEVHSVVVVENTFELDIQASSAIEVRKF